MVYARVSGFVFGDLAFVVVCFALLSLVVIVCLFVLCVSGAIRVGFGTVVLGVLCSIDCYLWISVLFNWLVVGCCICI